MNMVLKIFLSMSFSGGLLILILLLGRCFLKDKISRQWQYYIWLVVVLRLLLPFGPETNLMGKVYEAVDLAITQTASSPQHQPIQSTQGGDRTPVAGREPNNENVSSPIETLVTAHPLQDILALFGNHIWLVWLVAALGLLIQKITIYQGFMRYINAGLTPVSDMELLDNLSIVAERSGVKGPVELCVNPLVSSPLLVGFFHPCIVLPSIDISEKDFQYIVLHELTHYKRRDIFYKWLVQAVACLHWFNPLVHLMSREITKACEFSCDEAVLTKIGGGNEQDYGKTLLDAMVAVRRYKENPGAVTLSENKQLLKERLGAIMDFENKKRSTTARLLMGVLTLCVILSAAFVGVYPVASAANDTTGKTGTYIYDENSGSGWYLDDEDRNDKDNPTQAEISTYGNHYAAQAERYYEADSLPLFQMAFSRLEEKAQEEWLDRIFKDRRITFMGAAVNLLEDDCAAIQHLAETIYKDGDIVYFSILTQHMGADALEDWLDRALTDKKWALQSVLFNSLDRDYDELEELQNKAWAEAQTAEYEEVGVTFEGKSCYYQGQLVNIFLDIRANKSFYTLDMNPMGTVNIKIIRDTNNNITGVVYMTEEEVTELFGDMDDSDRDVKIIPVNLKNVAAGETVFLGEYTLSDGDEILYDISVKTGNRIKVFFDKDEQKDVVYWSVNNLRQSDEPLECIADFTVGPPATKPGTYKLYLQAPDGALGDVRGSVSIVSADAS